MSSPDSPAGIQSKKRTLTKLKPQLERILFGYAAAAGAAGVGLLGLAEPSPAEVVYTPAHETLHIFHHTQLPLDLNHDGVADFTITAFGTLEGRHRPPHTCTTNVCTSSIVGFLSVAGAEASNGVVGVNGHAQALPINSEVGSSAAFLPSAAEKMMGCFIRCYNGFCGNPTHSGSWYGAKNRFLGLKFTIDGQTHFGWARFTVASSCGYGVATVLTGYAYETEPNMPIRTGHTSGNDVKTWQAARGGAILEPASLGRLAQGDQGLASWRNEGNATSGR